MDAETEHRAKERESFGCLSGAEGGDPQETGRKEDIDNGAPTVI